MLAPHRRDALLAWAKRTGALVVEDDYDGEFRYDHRSIGALQGLAPDLVAYIGSASKTLAPALRLGWLVAPPALREQLALGKFLTDHGAATLDQLALVDMLTRGAYDRHIRQSRARYRAHRTALEAAVALHDVPLRLAGIPAGVQTLAVLLDESDPDAVVRRAADAAIGFDPIGRYQVIRDVSERSLVLGYGNITPNGINQAMHMLARIMRTG